jgi:hypothetical protein
MIDLTGPDGVIRLDPSDFDAIVEAARHPGAEVPDHVRQALAHDPLRDNINVILDPAAEIRLVVAGPAARLVHRGWLTDDALVLLLGVGPELLQLMKTDPASLTATLVRLTRMRPRHLPARAASDFPSVRLDELTSPDPRLRGQALTDADAGFAWHLDVASDSGRRTLTAVDGDLGLHFAYPQQGQLVPVTNTFCYRVLSTVLAPA